MRYSKRMMGGEIDKDTVGKFRLFYDNVMRARTPEEKEKTISGYSGVTNDDKDTMRYIVANNFKVNKENKENFLASFEKAEQEAKVEAAVQRASSSDNGNE